MNRQNQFVTFSIEEQRYALYLSSVERIIRVVEITPLPKAPEIVIGIINVQGQVIPVINMRRRFNLPEREIELNDKLIIAHTSKRTIALVSDEVIGVIEQPDEEIIPLDKIIPKSEHVEGIVKLEDGMILIHNLDKFLSLEEEKGLDFAIQSA
jgi:purine-binding chemotaxis protein CheW